MFYYISSANLAAVIIHAVGDLVTSPKVVAQFWTVSPIEFLIFWIGVIVTIFTSIENGIYATVGASAAVMLFRIAKARGRFLGQVPIGTLKVEGSEFAQARNVYVALDHSDGTNPDIVPISPPKGIFIYRFSEGYISSNCYLANIRFLYPNANRYTEHMVGQIFAETRPGCLNPYGSLGERPWNDHGPRHPKLLPLETDHRPQLTALILDFSGVPHLDVNAVQNLVDCRKQLDRHAGRPVTWHFVGIANPWIKRALVSANFGTSEHETHAMFSVSNIGQQTDPEYGASQSNSNIELTTFSSHKGTSGYIPLLSLNKPYFHADIDEAIKVALHASSLSAA